MITGKKLVNSLVDNLNELALQAPAGCRGLFYFPYLLGERAPIWNNYAKGMFIGLGMDTSRALLGASTAGCFGEQACLLMGGGGKCEGLDMFSGSSENKFHS